MLERLNRFIQIHGDTTSFSISLSLFRVLLGSMLLLKLLMLLMYPAYFPPEKSATLVTVLLSVSIVLTVVWLIGLENRWLLILLFCCFFIVVRWFFTLNYGGDFIASSLLLFVPFLITNRHFSFIRKENKSAYNELALVCIKYVFCGIYFFSGLNKILDISWQNGTALSIVLQLDFYNGSPGLNAFIVKNQWLSKLLTWVTLALEFIVPFTIWNRRLIWYSVIPCLLFHLGIIFSIKIIRFEIIMIAMVLLFVSDDKFRIGK